jgi:hypothetical protein
MSLNTLYHWMNEATRSGYRGPKQGAVLLKSGQVIELDFTDWQARNKLNAVGLDDVVATFTKAPRGGWSGQASVRSLRGGTHNVYSQDGGNDFDAVKNDILEKVAEYEADFTRLEKDPEAKLEALLKSHDWYHAYSDDYRYYAAGERSWKLIQEQAKLVDTEKVRELFEKHSPEDIGCPF